jgi:hypothetical protein
MLRLFSASAIALSVVLGAPAFSATNATLPGPVSTSLGNATSAADVAALVLTNPPALAATIMSQAAVLGIASPVQVLNEAISPTSSTEAISTLVCSAVEANPVEAELSSDTAFSAAGGTSWGPELPKILEAAVVCGIETSETNFPGRALPDRRAKGPPSFVELPSEAQTNPSNN